MKQLDRYYMMIVSQFVETFEDFRNILLVNKKFRPLIDMFHYNPIDITERQLTYFTSLETFHYYNIPKEMIKLDEWIPIVIHLK